MPANTIVPEQETGIQSDTVETIELRDAESAKKFFISLRQCMLDVNNWQKYSDGMSSSFELMNPLGRPKRFAPEIGDHFRISIPAPGSNAGDGYDWVRVEKMEDQRSEEEDIFMMQVRPSPNPHTPYSDEEVAHFFNDTATSSFIVRRSGNTVSAEVHGRNEKPNTSSEAVADKIRNTLVGLGAIAGFSKIQWKNLVKGLINAAG